MRLNPQFYLVYSHLLNKFLTEKLGFFALICASKLTENYCEEENNLFFESLCCFFIHIFRKNLCNFQFFLPLGVSMWGFENFRILFVWSFIHSTGIFFFARKKCDDLVVFFNKGREKNFFVIFIKSQKLCLHKIFNIVSTTKTNFPELWIFPEFPWTFPLLVSFF